MTRRDIERRLSDLEEADDPGGFYCFIIGGDPYDCWTIPLKTEN